MRKILLLVAGFLLVVIGVVYPSAVPSTKFEGWRMDTSNAAIESAETLLEHPLERLLIIRFRVVDIKDNGAADPDSCGSQRFRVDHAFEATVDALTVFGMRVSRVLVTCDGASRMH